MVKEAGQNILQHLRESTAEVERLKAEVARHVGERAIDDVGSELIPRRLVHWWMNENAELKAEVERLTKKIEGSSYYFLSVKLGIENAQLRKAGDAMDESIKRLEDAGWLMEKALRDTKGVYHSGIADRWTAAKESQPRG